LSVTNDSFDILNFQSINVRENFTGCI